MNVAAFLHGTKGVLEEMLKAMKSNGEEMLKMRGIQEEMLKEIRNNGDAMKIILADKLSEVKGVTTNTGSEYYTVLVQNIY